MCVSRKQLPQGLIDWGCDEELWSQVRNKKGLLDLLKKGDEERGRARIQKCREIVERRSARALETKLFVLKQEGELVVARRSGMPSAAYAAKSAAFNRTATTAVISESISLDGATVDAEIEARLASPPRAPGRGAERAARREAAATPSGGRARGTAAGGQRGGGHV